jgi:hypothetical protein
MAGYMPSLRLTEDSGGRVRLSLAGVTAGEGATLQEAADELVRRTLLVAMALRGGERRWSSALRPEPGTLEFLWKLGHFAATGGDIRTVIFGPPSGG